MFLECIIYESLKRIFKIGFHEQEETYVDFCLLQVGVLQKVLKVWENSFETHILSNFLFKIFQLEHDRWRREEMGQMWPLLTKDLLDFPTIAHALLRTAMKSISNLRQNIWLVEIAADFDKFLQISKIWNNSNAKQTFDWPRLQLVSSSAFSILLNFSGCGWNCQLLHNRTHNQRKIIHISHLLEQ